MKNASYIIATVGVGLVAGMSFWAAASAWTLTPYILAVTLTAASAAIFVCSILTLLGILVLYFEGYDPTND